MNERVVAIVTNILCAEVACVCVISFIELFIQLLQLQYGTVTKSDLQPFCD